MSLQVLKGIAILAGIFVGFPVLIFFLLRRLARPLIRAEQAHTRNRQITRTGYVVYSAQVSLMLICAAAYTLDSQGSIGGLLHTRGGVVGAAMIIGLGGGVAEALLKRLGYPCLRSRGERNV